MVSKKTKAKRQQEAAGVTNKQATTDTPSAMNGSAASSPTPGPSKQSSPEPENEVVMEDDTDLAVSAEKVKEQGNVAFKAGKYDEAVKHYTKAIEMNPNEPAYFTNRAASSMSIKRYRDALEDCQKALNLQMPPPSPSGPSPTPAAPPVKTLLRLARCQLALGSPTPALSTLKLVFDAEPKNAQAVQLKAKIAELEGHLKTLESARQSKNWGLARLALDKCTQAIDGEGAELPTEWRVWRVELELAKGNWDGANAAANDALRLHNNSPEVLALRGLVLFLCGKLPQATQHVNSALRLDPSHQQAQQLRKRVKDVERLKDEGNALFKALQYDAAIAKYTETLDRIGSAEEEGKGGQIRATLLSNRATTLVKLNRHEDALVDTNASLELQPNSYKALRTRARIHLHLEHFDVCIGDFKSAIQQAGSDGSVGEAEIRGLRSELKKAEVALKRSKTKDYYKILGVARDCTEIEIKKAYRRESLKHHPDKGGDEEKFKLVVEANSVLSDPQRRDRYDAGEDEDGMNEGGGGGFGGGMHGMNPADIAQMFAQFGGGSPFGGGGRGHHFHSGGF